MELYAMLFQQKQSSEEGGAGTIALDFLFQFVVFHHIS
jgi:hypothetical protein